MATVTVAELQNELEGIRRWITGEKLQISTGICGSTTYGYGDLDSLGYWQYPVSEALVTAMIKRRGNMPGAVSILEPLRAEIEAAWFGIEHGYEIEERALIEKEAKTNGFKYGLAQAVHTIWKREPKVIAARMDALTEALQCCSDLSESCSCVKRIKTRLQTLLTASETPLTLRELGRRASDALFQLHRYLQDKNDDWWREIYRHRCEVGMLVDARNDAHTREKET